MDDELEIEPFDWQNSAAACDNVTSFKEPGADPQASDASDANAPKCHVRYDGNKSQINDTNVPISHQGYIDLDCSSSPIVLQELQHKCSTLEKRWETLEYWLFSLGRVLGPGSLPAHSNTPYFHWFRDAGAGDVLGPGDLLPKTCGIAMPPLSNRSSSCMNPLAISLMISTPAAVCQFELE